MVGARIRRVCAVEALGAEVLIVTADVADLEQMRAAIAHTTQHFGAIHGVIHAAGRVGVEWSRTIAETTRQNSEWHFGPKVRGLLVRRQVLADSPDLMVVAFAFEAGAEGRLHHHVHVQATYVESGRFRFEVDGRAFEVGPGDSFVIPSGAPHGCRCLQAGRLIDSFTPRRDDFL